MLFNLRLLLCTLVVLTTFQPIIARKSFSSGRHSYPKSGGLSGGGHSYPHSGGLSGGGSQAHRYPSSGSNPYPSSGGHSYPNSGGHSYPNSGGHAYPNSGGLSGSGSSGSHGYPGNKGLSGNSQPTRTTHTTNVYNNYHYSPPQQISYSPVGGGPPRPYPVYHGSPPTYVYQYKDSGSKYGTLLAGLALLNLGTLAGVAYTSSQRSSHYEPKPGEVCKFGVKKDNGDYEETKIDCQLISSFIFQAEAKQKNAGNSSVVTTTVTNVTIVNTTNAGPEAVSPQPTVNSTGGILYIIQPNGTLVPLNASSTAANETSPSATSNNNTVSSSVTITTTSTNTTLTNALDVKGKPIDVTPGMQCYVLRTTPSSRMKETVPCGLLQTYAEKSIQKKNTAVRHLPTFTILAGIFVAVMF